MTKYTEYKTAEQLSLGWTKSQPIMVVSFVDSQCVTCQDFDDLVIPEIESQGIKHYSVDVRTDKIPFPPMMLPTSYWFFDDSRPPMVKKGVPPSKDLLLNIINKAKKVHQGLSTSEEEFF